MSTLTALSAVLDAATPGSLVALGRVRARPDRVRVHVVRTDPRPEDRFAAWITLDDWQHLRGRPPASVRVGSTDCDRWWTTDDGPFWLWEGSGWTWRVQRELERREPPAGWLPGDVDAVEAYVGRDWVEQGVRLRLRGGKTVPVSVDQNTSVRDAIFYDGIDLDWDTSWCRVLARSLASAVGARFVDQT